MFKNYLSAALRNLLRNKSYVGVNIVGLSIGFAAALLIALFIRDEFSFDRYFPDYQRIYLLRLQAQFPGRTAPTQEDHNSSEYAKQLRLE